MLTYGCAAILKGSLEKVDLASDPYGAKVYINGQLFGKTPLQVKLPANKTYYVEFVKEGYEKKTYVLSSSVGAGWIVLDILFYALPVVIDAATGSWYGFDDNYARVYLVKQPGLNIEPSSDLPQNLPGIVHDDTLFQSQDSTMFSKGNSAKFQRIETAYGTRLVGRIVSEDRDLVIIESTSGITWEIDKKFITKAEDVETPVLGIEVDSLVELQPLQMGRWEIAFATGHSIHVLHIVGVEGELVSIVAAQGRLLVPLGSITTVRRTRNATSGEKALSGATDAALYAGGIGGIIRLFGFGDLRGVLAGLVAAPFGFVYGGLFGGERDAFTEYDLTKKNREQKKRIVLQILEEDSQ